MSLLGRIKTAIFGRQPSGQHVHVVHDRRNIRAGYDLAGTNSDNASHWSAADSYDADSANSKAVRRTTVKRSRYEIGNNGYTKGITLTHANYVVGRGPKLRLQTKNAAFNAMVEGKWARWCKSVKLARKLRTATKAKVTDGESFLIARRNPNLRDDVKLDLQAIETEQCTSTDMTWPQPNRIDGIRFDEFGNPIAYDILPRHPGGMWTLGLMQAETVPARFVFHWFREDRPGQHRAIPELSPTLQIGAQSRRWRESTLQAMENIANVSLAVKTKSGPDGSPGKLLPFDTLEWQRGMMVALPADADLFQPKAEQPGTTYEGVLRTQTGELSRPLSMSYSLAACDSSNANFASAKLDQHPYFAGVDVDRADAEDMVLDPLFDLWFEGAVSVYGWNVESAPSPAHTWDWPGMPIVNEVDTANARKTNISTGVTNVPRIQAEDGYDAEEELAKEAEYYGVTIDEMRAKHFASDFQQQGGQPAEPPKPANNGSGGTPPVNRIAKYSTNGNGKAKVPA